MGRPGRRRRVHGRAARTTCRSYVIRARPPRDDERCAAPKPPADSLSSSTDHTAGFKRTMTKRNRPLGSRIVRSRSACAVCCIVHVVVAGRISGSALFFVVLSPLAPSASHSGSGPVILIDKTFDCHSLSSARDFSRGLPNRSNSKKRKHAPRRPPRPRAVRSPGRQGLGQPDNR